MLPIDAGTIQRIRELLPFDPRSFLRAPVVVTGLPTGAGDGQRITYTARVADTGALADVRYELVFDAKTGYWLPVGAATPLVAEVDDFDTTTSTSYAALTHPGPAIVPPFGGDWLCTIGAEMLNGTNSAATWMSVDVGAGAADGDGAALQQAGGANTIVVSAGRSRKKTLTAGVPVTCLYRTTAGSGGFINRFLNMTLLRAQ